MKFYTALFVVLFEFLTLSSAQNVSSSNFISVKFFTGIGLTGTQIKIPFYTQYYKSKVCYDHCINIFKALPSRSTGLGGAFQSEIKNFSLLTPLDLVLSCTRIPAVWEPTGLP